MNVLIIYLLWPHSLASPFCQGSKVMVGRAKVLYISVLRHPFYCFMAKDGAGVGLIRAFSDV